MGLPTDRMPVLIRVEGNALVCGGCRRRWRVPPELSEDNLQYLWEHTTAHQTRRKHVPDHQQRMTKWSEPKIEPVQCQTCFTWFSGRRCQRCFPDFRLHRESAPPATS